MVLTTGAMRDEYLRISIPDNPYLKYIYAKADGQKYTDTLSLYYYAYDEDHNPYVEPKIDRPEDYRVVTDQGEIELTNYLATKGFYDNNFVVISEHKRISSIENFRIKPKDKFYSVPVDPRVARFLLEAGIEKFEIHERTLDWFLPLFKFQNGREFLFFIESDCEPIQAELNNLRFEVLRSNVKEITELKIKEGVYLLYRGDRVCNFSYFLGDQIGLAQALENHSDKLYNGKRIYPVMESELLNIANQVKTNEEVYTKYSKLFLGFLAKKIQGNFNFTKYTPEPGAIGNFLVYGYTDYNIRRGLGL